MLKQPIIEKLAAMRLLGMAEALTGHKGWCVYTRHAAMNQRLSGGPPSDSPLASQQKQPLRVRRDDAVRTATLVNEMPLMRRRHAFPTRPNSSSECDLRSSHARRDRE